MTAFDPRGKRAVAVDMVTQTIESGRQDEARTLDTLALLAANHPSALRPHRRLPYDHGPDRGSGPVVSMSSPARARCGGLIVAQYSRERRTASVPAGAGRRCEKCTRREVF